MILRADLYRPWPILRAAREVDLLRSQGKDVTVVSWIKDENSTLPPLEVDEGVETRRVFLVPPKSILLRFPAFLKSNKLLAREAIDARPDALVVHDLEVLRAGVLAKRRLGVPLVYHAHEDWPAMVSERSRLEAKIFSFLEKRYCRRVDNVLVPSEGIGRKYREWGLKVTVQYASKSLADLPDITPDKRMKLRARYGFIGSDLVVGLAGSLGRAEAFNNILAAMKELPPAVKLLVVGGLEEKVKAAEKSAASKGLTERALGRGPLYGARRSARRRPRPLHRRDAERHPSRPNQAVRLHGDGRARGRERPTRHEEDSRGVRLRSHRQFGGPSLDSLGDQDVPRASGSKGAGVPDGQACLRVQIQLGTATDRVEGIKPCFQIEPA
jgi:hypothetical protein